MNKIHQTLWNAASGCYVVAHEKAATGGKPSSTRKAIAVALTATFGMLASLSAQALPSLYTTQTFTSSNPADGQQDMSAPNCVANGYLTQDYCQPTTTISPAGLFYLASGAWTGVVAVDGQPWLTFSSGGSGLGLGSEFDVANLTRNQGLTFGGLTLYQTSGQTQRVHITTYDQSQQTLSNYSYDIPDATATDITIAPEASFGSASFVFASPIPFGVNSFLVGVLPSQLEIQEATPADSSATLTFYDGNSGNSASTGYELVITPDAGSPVTLVLSGTTTGTTVRDGSSGIAATLGNNGSISITGLTNGIAYSASLAATNGLGTGTASSETTFTPVAPFVLIATPSFSVSNLVATISATSNDGNAGAYWVVLPEANAPPPSAAQIYSGKDSNGVAVPNGMSGSGPLSASQPTTLTISGLAPNTAYSACFVAEDGNSYSQVSCGNFTTGSAPAALVCDGVASCVSSIFYTGQTTGGVTTINDSSVQHYSYTFTASQTATSALTFLFRQDSAYFFFGNAALIDHAAPNNNLISNGDLSSYVTVTGNNGAFTAPTAWSIVGAPGLQGGGTVVLSSDTANYPAQWPSGNVWLDYSYAGFGGLAQGVPFISGHTYTLTFDLKNAWLWGGSSAGTLSPVAPNGEGNPTDDPNNILSQFLVFSQLPQGFTLTGGNLNPVATGNAISSLPRSGTPLTGSYTYSFGTGEGVSTFQWYSSRDTDFSNANAINGATSSIYTPVTGDVGNYLFFCVTPVAMGGATGYQSCSAASAAVLSSDSVTPPSAPTGTPTVVAGDGSVTVTFNSSASNGGDANVTYTVTCEPSSAFATEYPSNTGASTTITVSGLTNGTQYKCHASARNSGGTSGASSWTEWFTPAATPVVDNTPPPPPANPFNPGGTSTVNTLPTTSLTDTGGTYTPGTSSLITNLSEVNRQAGVSDNGVVVILSAPNVPVKISSTAPNNVLFSLPSTQPISMQIGGQQISVVTNSQPIINTSTGQTTPSILATQTFTNSAGVTTQTLQVVSGQVTTTSTSTNQIVGGLTLSQGATLNNVVATAGAIGSSIGFYKNPTDFSGSVSAEQGDVTVDLSVVFPNSTADKSNKFSSSKPTTRTLTLKAGEVARFDEKANLIGVFAGSLSGSAGKTGDAITVTPPAGVLNYPKSVAKLDGNTLGRLGKNLLPAFLGKR